MGMMHLKFINMHCETQPEHVRRHQICALCVESAAKEESGQPVQNFQGRLERDLGLLVQHRNQATIISAEQPIISMAKKR